MVTTATFIAVGGTVLLVLLAELLHLRRIHRVARLAFGSSLRPLAWVRSVPLLRALGAGLLCFGLATLLQLPPKTHVIDTTKPSEVRHLVIVLDVSPSMLLADAGPSHEQQRNQRAKDLLKSLFERVAVGNYALSVIAVYNGAKPVVVDTHDAAVIDNILGDLPLRFAFKPGKTNLFDGIAEAAKVAKPWRPDSTIVAIVTDGDTVAATGMPDLPSSINKVLVVGVGDPTTGKFIDGKQSKQDVSTLRQIAGRLGGTYHNGNERHIPTDVVRELTSVEGKSALEKLTLREYALLAAALGAALLALIPLGLHVFGTGFRPGAVVRISAPRTAVIAPSRDPLLPQVNAAR